MPPNYDIRPANRDEVISLFERHHGYKSLGNCITYAFAVWESGAPVAAFVWQPPPPGSATAVCPEAPSGVLSLSRMVAVPRSERALNHISKPLKHQMRRLIDRGRWPALVTYSDSSLGHTGHVYKCSGWHKTAESVRPYFEGANGERRSSYRAGRTNMDDLTKSGTSTITRWEHWACTRGDGATHMAAAGWRRVPARGRWVSGNRKHTWVHVDDISRQMQMWPD